MLVKGKDGRKGRIFALIRVIVVKFMFRVFERERETAIKSEKSDDF